MVFFLKKPFYNLKYKILNTLKDLNMRLSKTKKIILSLVVLGVLTTSISIPILVVNNDKKNNQVQEKTKEDTKPNIDKLKVNLPSSDTLKNSNIINGLRGIIFQYYFRNLWAMGYGSKLQVLKTNKNKNVYVYLNSWINK